MFKPLFVLLASVLVVAYALPAQAIQQINDDFPDSMIAIDTDGHSARMILEAIVDPPQVVWVNEILSLNVLNNKLDSDASQSVSVHTKSHLYPSGARVRDLQSDMRLDTVFYDGGAGVFSLEGVNKGIYILDIIVRSNNTEHLGIYDAILFADNPPRDDFKIAQLTAEPTESQLLNITRALQ